MKRRWMLPLILAGSLIGCSDASDPVGVPAQIKSEAESRKAAEPEEPDSGVDKCQVYRVPPFCQVP